MAIGLKKLERGEPMNTELIAPCGMNCSVCSSYLALKHDVKSKGVRMSYCAGCRPRDKKCAFIKKRCTLVMNKEVTYCFECDTFPCKDLLRIDSNYRKKFRMSLVSNLETIRDKGVEEMMREAQENWRCPECGDTICCHNGICFNCGIEKLKVKKQLYRWDGD
jgi:hypothetical protein